MVALHFTVKTLTGRTIAVESDSTETIYQLVLRLSEATGIPPEYINFRINGVLGDMREKESDRPLGDFGDLSHGGTFTVYVSARTNPKPWALPLPNTRSLVDPNEMRYHKRILGQNLGRIYEARRLRNLANQYGLPENLEREIARGYLGHPRRGGKTRRSKKSRKTTRRRR
jgi:hypothetical protein